MISERCYVKSDEFLKCVNIKETDTFIMVECKMGLWSVEAPLYRTAMCEAYRYWQQYKEDGEYYEILGGPSPVEVLKEKLND